jgi:hypothetical protein
MACPRCQQDNPAEARFCMSCGTGLTLTCAKCHTQLPTGAAFCFACGQPVAAAPEGRRFTSPDAYTPRNLAEKILTSKSALEGERKQVTVLFGRIPLVPGAASACMLLSASPSGCATPSTPTSLAAVAAAGARAVRRGRPAGLL